MSVESITRSECHPPAQEWDPSGGQPRQQGASADEWEALNAKVDRLTDLVERLDRRREELEELVEDLLPAANGALLLARDRLQEMDRSGAWTNGEAAVRAVETGLAGLDAADLEALAYAAPTLLRTVRALASPEISGLAPSLIGAMQDAQRGPAPSLWTLLKSARSPRARRGAAVAIAVLGSLGRGVPRGAGAAPAGSPAPRKASPPTCPVVTRPPTSGRAAAASSADLRVEDRVLPLDADGNLQDPKAWSREVAEVFARQAGLHLTPEHWTVLDFVRREGAESGAAPGIRRIVAETGVSQGDLYRLFPGGPAVLAARLSGLKKPKSCV